MVVGVGGPGAVIRVGGPGAVIRVEAPGTAVVMWVWGPGCAAAPQMGRADMRALLFYTCTNQKMIFFLHGNVK